MANNSDYLIPFGVDPRKFFEGLNQMDEGTDKLANNVKDANQEMQKAFNVAASAGEVLGKTLDTDTKKALGLRDKAKEVGAELGKALDGKNIGNGIEDKVKKFTSLMVNFTKAADKPVKFDIDQSKVKEFVNILTEGADDLKILNTVITETKASMAGLDPKSAQFAELNQQVQTAEQFLKNLGDTTEVVTTKDKSLKAQLRELKSELAAMEIAGKETTQEFLNMSVKAGVLEDQIGDISQRVRVLASDTKYIDAGIQAVTGLAGAFAAAQGAAALFGSQNEAVNEVIQKVTGAMAILQGIQAVANALNKDSALSVLFFSKAQTQAAVSTVALAGAETVETGATVAATTATRGFTAALLSNPITAIAVAIAACVVALLAFTSGSDDAKKAGDQLNETLETQNKLLDLDTGALNRRTDLLVSQTKLRGEQLMAQAKTDAQRLKISQETEDKVTQIEGKSLAERANLLANKNNELAGLLNDRTYVEKLSGEDFKKLQAEQLKTHEDYLNAVTAVEVKRSDLEQNRLKQQIDLTKAEKQEHDKGVENAKKAAEQRKAVIEQELKFRKELEAAFVEQIIDQYEKEKQTAKKNAQDKIDELNAEKALSVKAEQTRNDAIVEIRRTLSKTIQEIDKKREADRAQLLFEGQQKMAELMQEGAAKDLEQNRLSFEERKKQINEQFKNEGALRVSLLDALEKDRAAKEKKIRDDAKKVAVQQEEDRQVLEIETAARFLPDLPNLERQKQIEILKVKLQFAEASYLGIKLARGNENDLEVLQAKKVVQDLKKELGTAEKELNKAGGFDLFKALGLGNLSDDQRKAVTDALGKDLDSIRQISDFIVGQFQRQIDAKQKVIDQETNDIDRLENQLGQEKDLREQGLANNVDNLQAELDAKKAQRDEDIKQQEDLAKKQQGIQRVQLALDTATQASSLITSAAIIFRTLASIPFAGVPLAIATIALMVGSFVTAKVKAFQAVSDGQKFEGGGWIDGKPHSQGGKKYRANDGSVIELEGGEFVTRKTAAEKYSDLLEAINRDDLTGMDEEALRAMLGEMGIHLSTEKPAEAVNTVREVNTIKTELSLNTAGDVSPEVKEINKNVSFLAEQERRRIQNWEDKDYFYTQEGNKITKIRKA